MKLKFRSGLVVCALAFAVGAAAAEETKTTTAALESPGAANGVSLASKGKQLYVTNCVHCHGINMVTPGTIAYDLRQFPPDDHARFVNSVTHGKNNRMPAWGDLLQPDDIEALWAYVLTGGKVQ